MKSLYAKGKGKIHPSPACPGALGHSAGDALAALSLLPAAIIALTAALRAEDREVLAYMVTRSLQGPWSVAAEGRRRCWRLGHHQPLFSCGSFDCYTSYWFRWDSSTDRELIHQAIEAFEEHLASSERRQSGGGKGGRRRDRRLGDRPKRTRGQPGDKDKNKRKPGKDNKEKFSAGGRAGGTGGEGPSAVLSTYTEEEDLVAAAAAAEKVYYAELVLESELAGGEDEDGDDGECQEAAATGMEIMAMRQQQGGGERRRGWADVIGLLNSRFWSLWSPGP